MKELFFFVNDQKLTGHMFYPKERKKKNPAILFIHGLPSSETGSFPRAEALAKLGYICMTFNLRGNGTSEGNLEEFSCKDHMQDVLAAYDLLASEPEVDKNKIHVIGASYGGYLAALLSSQRNVYNLVLRAPVLYSDKDFSTSVAKLQQIDTQFPLTVDDNMALKAIVSYSSAILLIESEQDTCVPHEILEIYRNAVSHPQLLMHTVLRNADHDLSTSEYKQDYIQVLVTWFSKKRDN